MIFWNLYGITRRMRSSPWIDANSAFHDMLGWEWKDLRKYALPPFIFNMSKLEHQVLLGKLHDGENLP
jgi:hypothetical protein